MNLKMFIYVFDFQLFLKILKLLLGIFITIIFITIVFVIFVLKYEPGELNNQLRGIALFSLILTMIFYFFSSIKIYKNNLSYRQTYSRTALESCPELSTESNKTKLQSLESALLLHDWKNQAPLF